VQKFIGVSDKCPLSPIPSIIYLDEVIKKRQIVVNNNLIIHGNKLTDYSFLTTKIFIKNSEDQFQVVVNKLWKVTILIEMY
jgi:hypothetical protein